MIIVTATGCCSFQRSAADTVCANTIIGSWELPGKDLIKPVTLTVDNFDGSLMDGAWLQYSFVTSQSDDCILVPTSCVKYVSDTQGNRCCVVFVRRDSRPEDTPELNLPEVMPGQRRQFPAEAEGFYPVLVETGISDTQNVEILSGLEEMDEVFVNYTVTDYSGSW